MNGNTLSLTSKSYILWVFIFTLLFSNRAFSIEAPYIQSNWTLPSSGYIRLTEIIYPANDPVASSGQVNPAFYYSVYFGYGGGASGEGYMGIQKDTNGKRAIFSVWGADYSSCSSIAGAICRPFSGEGSGQQTFIPYYWKAGNYYTMKVDYIGNGWRSGSICYNNKCSLIGYIHHPWSTYFGSSVGTFTEYYGGAGQVAQCWKLPRADVYFGTPKGWFSNNLSYSASYPPYNRSNTKTSPSCPGYIQNYDNYWVRHWMGTK